MYIYDISYMCLICQRVFPAGELFQCFQMSGSALGELDCDFSLARFSRYSGGGTYFYKLAMFQALCQALNKHDLI